MIKYVVCHEKHGVFLANVSGVALFSRNEFFYLDKAFLFDKEQDAKDYVAGRLKKEEDEFIYLSIDAKKDQTFVDVVDLIKQGYEKHTGNMLHGMPMISEALH